jgi:hypothetical protein
MTMGYTRRDHIQTHTTQQEERTLGFEIAWYMFTNPIYSARWEELVLLKRR